VGAGWTVFRFGQVAGGKEQAAEIKWCIEHEIFTTKKNYGF
jgi:hypothetical protein